MNNGISLYIHIPFCRQKCLYCDFPSFSGKENFMYEYILALCKEINFKVNKKVNTIFIGGGTPTYLTLECLNILKNSIDNLDKDENFEFTVEGNPDSFSKEKLEFFKSMGVNRLSIGLQAWQNNLLKKIGRIHNREQFINTYNEARKIGFNNINVDLMMGLPNQSLNDFKETLNEVIKLNPEHISCYSLIVEEGTVFYDMDRKGKLNLPDEDDIVAMYDFCVNFLKDNGYLQYEISNFSKKNLECKHNLTYWNLKDYIGCGSGAHSYIEGLRYKNYDDIEKYINMINKNKNAVIEEYKNTIEDEMEEFMFLGLRKIEGISIKDFKNRFKIDIYDIYKDVIEKFVKRNLLIINKDRIYLSYEGVKLSNQVMCEFILN